MVIKIATTLENFAEKLFIHERIQFSNGELREKLVFTQQKSVALLQKGNLAVLPTSVNWKILTVTRSDPKKLA